MSLLYQYGTYVTLSGVLWQGRRNRLTGTYQLLVYGYWEKAPTSFVSAFLPRP